MCWSPSSLCVRSTACCRQRISPPRWNECCCRGRISPHRAAWRLPTSRRAIRKLPGVNFWKSLPRCSASATANPCKVRCSTLDGQSVDREVMLSASTGTSRFQGRLPDRFSRWSRTAVCSKTWNIGSKLAMQSRPSIRVTVFARPTLVVEKIRYQFPTTRDYRSREVEGTGDIQRLEGTKVTLYALANHDIASAQVDFNADGRHDLPMTADKTKATAQFTLGLRRRSPHARVRQLRAAIQNNQRPHEQLAATYSIDVTPDYAPEIELIAPVDEDGKLVEQLDVPMDSPFTVEVEARDPDFALANVVVLGEVAGEQVLRARLAHQGAIGQVRRPHDRDTRGIGPQAGRCPGLLGRGGRQSRTRTQHSADRPTANSRVGQPQFGEPSPGPRRATARAVAKGESATRWPGRKRRMAKAAGEAGGGSRRPTR